jgi:RNA polymerase sigma-70 factor (ECF subfamily)
MEGSGSNQEIAGLIARCQQGDPQAEGLLLAAYRPYLRLVARQRLPKLLLKRADASDIVQQTLVDAVGGLPNFRGQSEAELTAWMIRLLERNLLQNTRLNLAAMRDVRREDQGHAADDSAQLVWHEVAGRDSSPQSSVFRGEAALLLAQALEQLPDQQRLAVQLRYLEQQTLESIAQEMDKTAAAVAGLIARGVEGLRRLLPKGLGDS